MTLSQNETNGKITGIKRVDDKLYAIVYNGTKMVQDAMVFDGRDSATSYKEVDTFDLVELTREGAKFLISEARKYGLLPSDLNVTGTIWIVNFS